MCASVHHFIGESVFIDWLKIHQDFDFALPFLSDTAEIVYNVETGEEIHHKQPVFKHEGSFSTSLKITISGNRITVDGNPSRINRLDNLFGFETVDNCISTYNFILLKLGLPPFTRCSKLTKTHDNRGRMNITPDGAVITRLDITTNKSVGEGNETDYIRGLSTQRYRNSIPNLHANGQTVDWRSAEGNTRLIYASVYNKANEINLKHLRKAKRKYGVTSDEYLHINKIYNYCKKIGVVRCEQKLKSPFLSQENLRFWGLADYSKLEDTHNEFLKIDDNLGVNAMTYESISDLLIENEVCKSITAANCTAGYYFQWLHGASFDLTLSKIKIHRARLRKINIDIAEKCDTSKHTAVRIKEVREIEVSNLIAPDWYGLPTTNHLSLVA